MKRRWSRRAKSWAWQTIRWNRISKIKNAGSTIFLNDSATSLGLGTGVIVSDNGYILTNEHVSGSKYGNCYVTLENGSTYNANVVWSDSEIDLSIIKINEKNLSYAKLGDSDNIRVGETVFAIRKSNWIWISKNRYFWNY